MIKPLNWHQDPHVFGIHGEYAVLVAEEHNPEISAIILEEPGILSEPLETVLEVITIPVLRYVAVKNIILLRESSGTILDPIKKRIRSHLGTF